MITPDALLSTMLGAALGGAVSTAWSVITLGNRLTRLETAFTYLSEQVKALAERQES